jgi:cytochrome c oxidase assembly protein Cox11
MQTGGTKERMLTEDDQGQLHQDNRDQLRSQQRSTAIYAALITAGLAMLGWMSVQLYDMNASVTSIQTQVGSALKRQDRQSNKLDEHDTRIRDNAEAIRRNKRRIDNVLPPHPGRK